VVDPRDRRGLGRGLAALLGDPAAEPSGALRDVAVDQVAPNPEQPRGAIDPAALKTLADSIARSGVLQPVVVSRAGPDGRHLLIAGERRWRAAQIAGLERIPAVVRDVDARERLELALVENLVREDLNAIEIALACATLVEDFGQSHAEVGARIGRSRPAVSNLMRLLELPEEVQAMVADGALSEGHARAVLMADGAAARRRVAERAVTEELSVRATEALARQSAPERAHRRRPPPPAEVAEAALTAFGGAFDAPVRVRPGPGEGVVVELRFADRSALQQAIDRIRAAD
jgi:ParB family transcriptional regulator, chromosome partitioning protein